MKIATRIASARPLARTALTLPKHGGVAGFIRLGYISDDVETLEAGVGKILAFGDAHARGLQ